MLRYEGTLPELIAYDRPSPKLLGFLRKHCGLSFPVPQSNNFVLFEKFFSVPRGTQTAAAQESARICSLFGEGFGESLRSSSADGARSPSLSLSEGSSSVCTGQGGHDVPLLPLSVPLSPLSVPLSPHSVPLSPHSVRSPTALFTSGCPAYSVCLSISLCVRCLGSHLVSHGGSMAAALRETAHYVGRQAAALAGGVAVLTGETAHSSGVRQPTWLVMSLSSQGRQPILSDVRQPPWLVMSLSSQGRQHISSIDLQQSQRQQQQQLTVHAQGSTSTFKK